MDSHAGLMEIRLSTYASVKLTLSHCEYPEIAEVAITSLAMSPRGPLDIADRPSTVPFLGR